MAPAQSFQEGFENFSNLFSGTNPWSLQNRSDSATGGIPWFQGDPGIFAAQSGTGYVAANYLGTGGITGTEHVSNWFISPTLNLVNGGTISFYTRSASSVPDHLELRLSMNGSSTNVGTTSSDVGDFSTLLLTINPTLTMGLYPTTWTQFTAIIAGVPAGGTVGRVAFHYDVTNSGSNGTNGDYVGVDNLSSSITIVPEPSATFLCVFGVLIAGGLVARRAPVPAARQKS